MQKIIGHSTIFGFTGNSYFSGARGPTGETGPNQTIGGPTGNTGIDSNYITEVSVNQQTGNVTLKFSDDTLNYNAGVLKGPSGVYAGITASSIGNGIPLLKGVCGGITLEFYNFDPNGLFKVVIDTDGSLKLSVNSQVATGSVSGGIEANRLLYSEQKNLLNTTLLHIKNATTSQTFTAEGCVYIDFGISNEGRSVVADITETILTVGPISRGNKIITVEDFYKSSTSGITLDLSYASVYKIITPIGIKAFSTDNAPISDGQVMSVTLIIEGDEIWNFPENVWFDEESNVTFYPGTNILHLTKTQDDIRWRAHFSARGFGVNQITNPGLRGSCCYFEDDSFAEELRTKRCEEYVTENYCLERVGTFAPLTPCESNPCIITGTKTFDGVCCSEGKCLPDIDPDLCQAINGYYLSGVTCDAFGAVNDSTATNDTGLCYNRCKPGRLCCVEGTCRQSLTKIACENILGGKSVPGERCSGFNQCCDLLDLPGACCISSAGGLFTCEQVSNPYECKYTKNGYYMGINSECSESLCCNVPIDTCYECVSTTSGCNCQPTDIYTGTCASNNLLTEDQCNSSCVTKRCRKCECDGSCTQIETCSPTCPSGYVSGTCSATTCSATIIKKCYKPCQPDFTNCESASAVVPASNCKTCVQLISDGLIPTGYILDECDCDCTAKTYTCYKACNLSTNSCGDPISVTIGDQETEIAPCDTNCLWLSQHGYVPPLYKYDGCYCEGYVACFWCYPDITGPNDGISQLKPCSLGAMSGTGDPRCKRDESYEWLERSKQRGRAPYRAVHLVPRSIYEELEAETNGITHSWSLEGAGNYQLGPMFKYTSPPAGLKHLLWKGYHYIEVGGSVITPTSELYSVKDLLAPLEFPFDDSAQFYCTYLGSYQYSGGTGPNNNAINKNNCLERFGYTTAYQKNKCTICNPTSGIAIRDPRIWTWQDEDTPKEYVVNKIEKYHDVLVRGIYGPFPPIWGRFSMFNVGMGCGYGAYKDTTGNLSLFHPRHSLDMAKSFAGRPGASVNKGWKWWSWFVGPTGPYGGFTGQWLSEPWTKAGKDMDYAVKIQLGEEGSGCDKVVRYGNGLDPCSCSDVYWQGDAQTGSFVSSGDFGPPGCPNSVNGTWIPYDPYQAHNGGRMLPNYAASVQGPVVRANWTTSGPQACPILDFPSAGWSHYAWPLGDPYTRYPQEILGFVADPSGPFNWFDNKELNFQKSIIGINQDGFTYDRICGGSSRGILGRNLRYNLFEFNTSTVFFNNDGITPTMFPNENPSFAHPPPLLRWGYWGQPGTGGGVAGGCIDTSAGIPSVGNCDACCVPDPSNGVCCDCPSWEFTNECTGAVSKGCGTIQAVFDTCPDCEGYMCPQRRVAAEAADPCVPNAECNDPTCGDIQSGGASYTVPLTNEVIPDGKLAPMYDESGNSIFSNENRIVEYNLNVTSRSVQIAPGICVNMLCPECDSYERC